MLLGDVIASRKIEERDAFQRRLGDLCERINATYPEEVYAPFRVLKGIDEIGGALTDISNLYNIIIMISEHLLPEVMRCAMVFDYVDTALESRDLSMMDGPAFHRAAQAVSDLKRRGMLFSLVAADEILDRALQGEINLLLLLRGGRSARERQIINEYELLGNQAEVAKRVGTSQQYVSLVLTRSRWRMLKGLEEELCLSLKGYQGRLEEYMKIEGGSVD